MAMPSGTIEIMAAIIIIASVIKMIGLLVNAQGWMNFAKKFYSNPAMVRVVGLIVSAIALYYLVLAGIGISEILAVMLFMAALIVVGMAPYAQDMFKMFDIKTIWKEQWLYVLIWLALIIWGAYEVFII